VEIAEIAAILALGDHQPIDDPVLIEIDRELGRDILGGDLSGWRLRAGWSDKGRQSDKAEGADSPVAGVIATWLHGHFLRWRTRDGESLTGIFALRNASCTRKS
jgi:hypothetical protein